MKALEVLSKNKILYALGTLAILLIAAISHFKGSMEILDTKFFYLKSEVQPLLTSLGEVGRVRYQKINTLDFLFIATYTLFLCGAYFAFFKDIAKVLILVPLLLCLADLTETSAVFYILKTFPQSHDGVEYLLMFVTPLKWILALSSLLIIVNGYFVNLYMKKT
jgi:hypothetical protein